MQNMARIQKIKSVIKAGPDVVSGRRKIFFISDDVNISAVKLFEISDDQQNILNCKCSTAQHLVQQSVMMQ